ncbi:MAG TPA: translation initiation factor IF-2 [Dehalococcoidia bacterium]|jgi:translation initiation factor IF-2|nr:translation initiation factor IF-2 [Chloroflexota bacterium]MDP5878109.1 translation initiation factor IF-2 [Dehalococcoidia bacterium]MDP6273530.1 translation initiation factor IF-2 [Dehalococcoidia bacterium]MDP7160339.1 translation initiation factor IF-2 [Dehalococcoidia bacterium]MDP7213911.1 translation initiation factor IF-2 [Dehalococcoidia bacterium]|tara:strand:+ start:376 stop:2232 length:1857 start_codon:yes stop_codon:yes gene_type:complete
MARRRSGFAGRPRGRGRRRAQPDAPAAVQEQQIPTEPIEIPAVLTVGELAEKIGTGPVETIKLLMRRGLMVTVNDPVDFANAAAVAGSIGVKVLRPQEEEESIAGEDAAAEVEEADPNAVLRPPVITVLGHVDHGKTTLLDSIRNSSVVDLEAGGITQSIGASQVDRDGLKLTFIDTPGHEAFTMMRARGAQITDIVVLVVAADDGIMPQTNEAIDHAAAAGVPMVIAINKVDLPGSDSERVKRELAERNILVESWGGDVVSVEVSALKGDGIDDLLENLVLLAEVQELKANPDTAGVGVCLEAHVDPSRGSLASILVRSGTLKVGDQIVVGKSRGRVRGMVDTHGNAVKTAGPSDAVEVMGLGSVPEPGIRLDVVASEKVARRIVEDREKEDRGGDSRSLATLSEVMRRLNAGDAEELSVIIKTGTQGSIDALRRSAEQISDDEVQINLIHAATGPVNESDVMLASASGALIMAFETGTQAGAEKQAGIHGVDIRQYNIIYDLIDDLRSAGRGLLAPIENEVVLGHAIVQAIFPAGRRYRVAGVRVLDGEIARTSSIRIQRDGEAVYTGQIASLRHFKDDVHELAAGLEGGVGVEGFIDFQEGDILEVFEIQLEVRS